MSLDLAKKKCLFIVTRPTLEKMAPTLDFFFTFSKQNPHRKHCLFAGVLTLFVETQYLLSNLAHSNMIILLSSDMFHENVRFVYKNPFD